MDGIYDIFCGGQAVGTAKVSREGLYICFDCECSLPKIEICKIVVICDENEIVLGTPIPEGQIFKLHTKLSAKRFPWENFKFYISNGNGKFGKFIPVCENEPFQYLKDLRYAVYEKRNGVAGVVIYK